MCSFGWYVLYLPVHSLYYGNTLMPLFLIIACRFNGISLHPQCLACSICHAIRCSSVGCSGIGCLMCHSLFSFILNNYGCAIKTGSLYILIMSSEKLLLKSSDIKDLLYDPVITIDRLELAMDLRHSFVPAFTEL